MSACPACTTDAAEGARFCPSCGTLIDAMSALTRDPDATGRATRAARRASPNLQITARTAYKADVERLEEAGAPHVFAAEVTVAGAITDRVIRSVDSGPDAEPEPSDACADGVANQGTER